MIRNRNLYEDRTIGVRQGGPYVMPRSEADVHASFGRYNSIVPLPEIDLFTDGACIGNPGPGGWAYILRHRKSGVEKCVAGGLRDTTNNRMEILAVIEGLAALKRPSQVMLHSDSQYVINGLRDWMSKWKRRGFRRRIRSPVLVKNADLWRRADELMTRHEMAFTWVRGHAGHPENERCDVMSVQAARKAANDPAAPVDERPIACREAGLFDEQDDGDDGLAEE